MTVRELIKELEKIEDKDLDVISGTCADENDCLIEYVDVLKEWYVKDNVVKEKKCVRLL